MAAMGVMDADWTDGDVVFLYACSLSLLVAAALAASSLSGLWSTLLSGLTGILFVGQTVARLLPPVIEGTAELWKGLVWLASQLRRDDLPPPAFPLWRESGTRLAIFGERLTSWALGLLNGQSERNPVAFLFVSGLILWACTAWAVWWIVRRGRPLLAMLPLGLVLSMSTYLSSGPVGWLVGFVGCVTVLLPVVHLGFQEWRWEREGIDYSTEIRFDVWQIAIVLTIAVVVLSLITPDFSIPRLVWSFWELISHPQAVIQDLLIRFFGGVEPDTPPELPVPGGRAVGGGQPEASLPRSHLLGGSPSLTDQRVMYVCIDAPPPEFDEYMLEEVVAGPKFYWRGITYDTFTGRSWRNQPGIREQVTAYEPILSGTISPSLMLEQRYLIEVPHGDTLYAVGEPLTVDQTIYRRIRAPNDLVGLEGATSDYVVHSQVSQATATQLREAPAEYSERIAEQYLVLSGDTPGRVRALADEITAGTDLAYDKAIAIERYLRQFPYDLEVPTPPSGQDAVEFFLFDIQRGYCDYYASSFVVLARAAGVPARLAVGYAMGYYDTVRGCYAVTERDGHSWPEVYFPGYGWIPFEPTAPFRLFERPLDQLQPSEYVPSIPAVPQRPWSLALRAWWREARGQWTTYLAIAGIAALVALLAIQAYRQWWRGRLTAVESIALYYRDMSRMAERLGVVRRPYDTPAEYGAILASALRQRGSRWPWRGQRLQAVIREVEAGVHALSRTYEHASYGAHSLVKAHQIRAEREWRQLQRQMRWLWMASTPTE
jgi:transglutaminase-like putative cysteine protease